MKKTKSDEKWKILTYILTAIVVFSFLFTDISKRNMKNKNQILEDKVSKLEKINTNLSQNINELTMNIETKSVDEKDNLMEEFNKVSNQFVEIYPSFNIEKIEEKRLALEEISLDSIASSIVPDDMITSSKRTLENLENDSTKEGEAYSSDPTFKSKFKESKVYTRYSSEEVVRYYSEVTYTTESSSGDTEDTVYLLYDVSNKDGKIQVTNYEIKYFN